MEFKNWESPEALFEELNNKFIYLVLRNHEGFFGDILLTNHQDIDILCLRKQKGPLLKALGAIPRLAKDDNVHYKVQISSCSIPVDLRYTGDGYYDKQWEQHMLQKRIKDIRGFYKLCDEDYYWSLLYHALYHKGQISDEYANRLTALNIGLFQSAANSEIELYNYMIQHNYYYTYAKDRYLWYYYTPMCADRLKGKFYYFISNWKEYLQNGIKRIYPNESKSQGSCN